MQNRVSNGGASNARKAGEVLTAGGLGGVLAIALPEFWPDMSPQRVGLIVAAAVWVVASGTSILRRLQAEYKLPWLRILTGIGLVLVLGGCTGIGPFSGMPYAGGDSDHDSAACKGPGQVWHGEVTEDEKGKLEPTGEGWLVSCQAGGKAYWQQGESRNRELIEGIAREAARGAAEGASPVE